MQLLHNSSFLPGLRSIESIEPRCTRFAADLLRELEQHPRFAELVIELAKIEGTIFRLDVAYAFAKLEKPRTKA